MRYHSIIFTLFISFFIKTLQAQHPNIMIDSGSDIDEPSICLNPKNPAQLVAGANVASIYYSQDTGKTWSKLIQKSSYGVWGDPVIVCDTAGVFYHFHLSNPSDGSWIDRIVCQKSTDGGQTWDNGSFMGLNGSKNQDKHWITIDKRTHTLYSTWTQFDLYESHNPQDSSHILFSKSTDNGRTWSEAQRINQYGGDCLDDDNTVEGAVPTVGDKGEIYVSWAGPKGLMFDKSVDGGQTWLANDIKVADIGGGWSYNISGIYRCNGLPVTLCDTSNSPYKGTIYINWSDQRNGASNTDIWLVKSKDGGLTWTTPKKVNNDDSKRQQFMTWMTIDPANGNLWCIFYDRRHSQGDSTDVYLAVSKDGGETFLNFKVSEQPFLPNSQFFFGDYTNITAYNNIVRPIWTAMNYSGKKTIYTALVNPNMLTHTEGVVFNKAISNIYSFYTPTNNQLSIHFDLKKAQKLCIHIEDSKGNKIAEVARKQTFKKGENEYLVDSQMLNLPKGSYTYHIKGKWGKKWAIQKFEVKDK